MNHTLTYTDRQGRSHAVDAVQGYGSRINSGQRLVRITYTRPSGVLSTLAVPIDALHITTTGVLSAQERYDVALEKRLERAAQIEEGRS